MIEPLYHLATMEGVSGLCLHRGSIIKWQRLPEFISPDRAAALCSAVSRTFASYASAERLLNEAWFGFGTQNILVIARPPVVPAAAANTFVTLLINNPAVAAEAGRQALAFLKAVTV